MTSRHAHRSLRCALNILVAVAILASPAIAQTADSRASALQQEIARRVNEYQENPNLIAGLYVHDLRTGKTLVDINSDRPLITASNLKLLTGAFALEKLGEKFHFSTSVYLRGNDIVIVGDGDPTIGCHDLCQAAGVSVYEELDRWVAAIKEKAGPAMPPDGGGMGGMGGMY